MDSDKILQDMEKEVSEIYKTAKNELQEKWDKYMKSHEPKVQAAYDAYTQSMLGGTTTKVAKAKAEYEKVLKNVTLNNDKYKAMVDEVTTKLANVNEVALDYVNGNMAKVYTLGYNDFDDQDLAEIGYVFTLTSEQTIKNLAANDKSLLPQKKLDIPKDKAWNTKNINSQVLQGILQGENISKISKRLQNVTDMNKNSAIRNARTMVTGAENKGRQDSFDKAEKDGIIMKRKWIATPGGRTRDWHSDLNGVEVDTNEPWENDYGKIMYPGDPTAHPANVYNCRCTMRAVVKGFDFSKQSEDLYTSQYADQYKEMSATAQYYSMLDEDKAVGKEFWKVLASEGKPSQVWKDYLAGNTPSEITAKIDTVLSKYKGTGKPIKPGTAKKIVVAEPPKPDLTMYKDKSMTATFYSIKAENNVLGKEFWSVIQGESDPSGTWKQYLNGTASKEITEKLDNILLQHKGTGSWTKPKKNAVSGMQTDTPKIKTEYDVNDVFELPPDIFSKVLKIAGSDPDYGTMLLSDYWEKYKSGDITNNKLDKILKDNVKSVIPKTINAPSEEDKELTKAKEKLDKAQKNLDSLGNKTYSGIWKDDVTLSDYNSKKSSIASKKQYYQDQIDHLDAYFDTLEDWEKAKLPKFKQYLDDLEEFETNGKLYEKYSKAYDKAAKEVKSLTPLSDTFGPEAYTQARKDMALWAKTSGEYGTLDKYYDAEAKTVHSNRTSNEYDGYYHYTWGSGPFNAPLAGFKNGFNTNGQGYSGPGNVDINIGGYGNKIKGLTSLIEKSSYDKDVWLQSGQYEATVEAFLKIPYNSIHNMTDSELQQFVNVEGEIPQFISTAINKGGGSYTPGDTVFNIYCPSGSEMLYVRKDGHFGKNEHEMILQRGGTYKLTKIYRAKDTSTGRQKLIVDFELHPENGYNKFQQ